MIPICVTKKEKQEIGLAVESLLDWIERAEDDGRTVFASEQAVRAVAEGLERSMRRERQ